MAAQSVEPMKKLDALQTKLETFYSREREDDDDKFYKLLSEVAIVVRVADAHNDPSLPNIVNKAGDILDDAVDWAYGDGDFDFLKSYAHSDDAPLIGDDLHKIGVLHLLSSHYSLARTSDTGIGHGAAQSFMKLFQSMFSHELARRLPPPSQSP